RLSGLQFGRRIAGVQPYTDLAKFLGTRLFVDAQLRNGRCLVHPPLFGLKVSTMLSQSSIVGLPGRRRRRVCHGLRLGLGRGRRLQLLGELRAISGVSLPKGPQLFSSLTGIERLVSSNRLRVPKALHKSAFMIDQTHFVGRLLTRASVMMDFGLAPIRTEVPDFVRIF